MKGVDRREDYRMVNVSRLRSRYFWVGFVACLFLVLLVIIVLVTSVRAGLEVSPVLSNVSVFVGQPSVFSLRLNNSNDFSVYNVSFSSVPDFEFPFVSKLVSGEVKNVQFVVESSSVYSAGRVSVVSFLYPLNVSVPRRSFFVNITPGGFVPSSVQIRSGDSVVWRNLLNHSADVRDLGTGFPGFMLASGGVFNQSFGVVKNFSFYEFPEGFTGSLRVVARENVSLVHSSVFDVPVTFSVSSVLNPGSLELKVLSTDLRGGLNGSVEGVLQVRNLDDEASLGIVTLSSNSSWVSFGSNGFALNPLESRFVYFNVSPKGLTSTGQTNRSYSLLFSASASEGLVASKSVGFFVEFANLSVFSVNGTTFVINRLGVNETILYCTEFPSEPECSSLRENFTRKVNVTIIKPGVVNISEAELRSMVDNAVSVSGVASRLENTFNEKQAYQDLISNRVDMMALQLEEVNRTYSALLEARDRELRMVRSNGAWWTIVLLLADLYCLVAWLVFKDKEFKVALKSLQV